MKNLSMISKPQTGYTVKKADVRKNSSFLARHQRDSFERFMQERTDKNIFYVGFGGMAIPQPRSYAAAY